MPRRENPLGSAEDELTRFAADLRGLREQAGTPTYRQLSARAHYSAAALSEAAGGRKLPSLPVTLAYVRACDGDAVTWEQRWRALSATQAKEPAEDAARPDETPPYAGFAAIEDPARYAGRADLVDELVTRVREQRLTAVVGASGSGKTSLLRAGLLPALTNAVVMTPGPNPFEECAIRVADLVGAAPCDLYRELAAAPENLHLRVRQALTDRPGELVLVVDRFEDALTGEHDDFVAALVHAATATTSRVRVVLGVRADVADRLPAAARAGQVHVGPMTADSLREAITEPASGEGCRVETALLVRLIADADGPGTLPFLQQALLGVWRRRRGTTLSIASYEAAGDLPRLIADAAERAFTALDDDGQRLARNLLPRLASAAGGLRRADLDTGTAAMLDELVRARVVVADADHLRLAGRTLPQRWPRLAEWLVEDGDRLRAHRELAEATTTWESLDRDPGALFRGVRLDTTRTWLAEGAAVITAGERDFLRASEAARTGELRRVRRVRAGLALLSVLVVLATGALAYAVRADRSADQQRAAAAAQSALREAAGLLGTDPALAMQLTIAAHRLDPTADSRHAVLSLFAEPYAARITAHTGPVHAVAVHGDLLATASDDATRLWDVGDPNHPRELAVLEGSATAAVFSADGAVLVTSTPAGASRWDLSEPSRPKQLTPVGMDNLPGVSPIHIALSRDGSTLALSKENDVRLYDVTDTGQPRRIGTLPGRTEPVTSVAFSPDGKTVLTTSADRSVRLWSVADSTYTLLARGNEPVNAAVFSPDGAFVATAGHDGMVHLWRVADRAQVATKVVHGRPVRDVTFSPDGTLLAATGDDGASAVWDVTDPEHPDELVTLTGHTDAGTGVRFTPDGRTLVTSSRDRTVRLTGLAEVLAGGAGTDVLAWDGTVLASGGDGTVRLFDVRDRHAPRALWTHDGTGLAFASEVLATGGKLWDAADPAQPQWRADVGDATGSALSRDGKLLVTTYADTHPKLWSVAAPGRPLADLPTNARTAVLGDGLVATLGSEITLWDLADPAHPVATRLPPQEWTGLALRPDGQVLAAMAADGTGWLWDVADPRAPKELGTFPAGPPTTAVAFAPDGRTLVTATGSASRLWDVSAPRRPAEITTLSREYSGPVAAVAFSADGRSFAAAGEDGTLTIWDVTVAQVERRVCAVVSPRLDEDVWERYLPGVPYRPVCP